MIAITRCVSAIEFSFNHLVSTWFNGSISGAALCPQGTLDFYPKRSSAPDRPCRPHLWSLQRQGSSHLRYPRAASWRPESVSRTVLKLPPPNQRCSVPSIRPFGVYGIFLPTYRARRAETALYMRRCGDWRDCVTGVDWTRLESLALAALNLPAETWAQVQIGLVTSWRSSLTNRLQNYS